MTTSFELPPLPFDEKFTDVILKTNDGTRIRFWKLILCQYEFYNTMFTSSFREGREDEVNIDCSTNTAKMILSVMYQMYRNLPEGIYMKDPIIFDMYKFAEQHCMDRLKQTILCFITVLPYSNELFHFVRSNDIDMVNSLTDKYINFVLNKNRGCIMDIDFDLMVEVIKKSKNIVQIWNRTLYHDFVSDEMAAALLEFIPDTFTDDDQKLIGMYHSFSENISTKRDVLFAKFIFKKLFDRSKRPFKFGNN